MIYILTIIAILLGVISPFLKKILLKKLSSEELFFLTAIITGLLAFLLFIYKNMKGYISWNIFKKPFTFDIKYLLFFTPSILFWGSGVLKEPILLLGIGLFFLTINKNL